MGDCQQPEMFLDRLVQNNTRVHLLVMGITIYANRYRNTHQGLLASFPIPIQVRQIFFSFPVATRASRERFDNNEDGEHRIISFRQTLSFFRNLPTTEGTFSALIIRTPRHSASPRPTKYSLLYTSCVRSLLFTPRKKPKSHTSRFFQLATPL